jgi:hypothetical protein
VTAEVLPALSFSFASSLGRLAKSSNWIARVPLFPHLNVVCLFSTIVNNVSRPHVYIINLDEVANAMSCRTLRGLFAKRTWFGGDLAPLTSLLRSRFGDPFPGC